MITAQNEDIEIEKSLTDVEVRGGCISMAETSNLLGLIKLLAV